MNAFPSIAPRIEFDDDNEISTGLLNRMSKRAETSFVPESKLKDSGAIEEVLKKAIDIDDDLFSIESMRMSESPNENLGSLRELLSDANKNDLLILALRDLKRDTMYSMAPESPEQTEDSAKEDNFVVRFSALEINPDPGGGFILTLAGEYDGPTITDQKLIGLISNTKNNEANMYEILNVFLVKSENDS